MEHFYADTDGWLRPHDHNHLRITRILTAVRALVGRHEAAVFHAFATRRNREAGSPVNGESLAFWERALG